MGVVGTIVCIAGRSNYNTLMAGRVIQGFGATAFESLSLATVGDIFYLHERGWRTALIVFTLACMAALVAMISGVITQNIGYRQLFTIALPFCIVGLLGFIFLLPETQFNREHVEIVARQTNSASDEEKHPKDGEEEISHRETKGSETMQETNTPVSAKAKKTYVQSLAIFSGTYTDKNLFRILIEVFVHLLNPAVIWMLLTSAVIVVRLFYYF